MMNWQIHMIMNRFDNSYGAYIHKQELAILSMWSRKHNRVSTFDVACGTGRFMKYANLGVDISERMIIQSKQKHPTKDFIVADATALPIRKHAFNNALCFHLFMHLDKDKTAKIFHEVARIIPSGGGFIWDIPSKHRRKKIKRNNDNWHGSFSMDLVEIDEIVRNEWNISKISGVGLFPIHRIPNGLRPIFSKNRLLFFAKSFLKAYASYLIIEMEKK